MERNQKIALVTGGGGGLGSAACLRLARDGMAVAVADMDLTHAEETARAIRAAGGEALALQVDVTEKSSVDNMFERLLATYGKIDCFLSGAGVYRRGDFLTFPFADWRRIMSVNVDGAILCCQRAAREMIRQGAAAGPYSIMLGMTDGACSQEGSEVADCSSGWALRGFMRHLALTLAEHNILVNAVAPGRNPAPPVEEVAAIVSFTFSDEAENLTGMTLMDNGGRVMT